MPEDLRRWAYDVLATRELVAGEYSPDGFDLRSGETTVRVGFVDQRFRLLVGFTGTIADQAPASPELFEWVATRGQSHYFGATRTALDADGGLSVLFECYLPADPDRRGDLEEMATLALAATEKFQAEVAALPAAAAVGAAGGTAAAGAAPDDEPLPPPEPLADVLAELDGLIGLSQVKGRINDLVATHRANQARIDSGLKPVAVSLHLVFTGDPGTGKTTVARLVSRIYRSLGILSSGHLVEVDRSDLVGQYIGHTAPLVDAALERADGGVLFIDEAYALTQAGGQDFGAEAVAQLVKGMEDRRGDLAVIVAGYTEPMKQFISSNPGLRSRFQNFMDFPNYSVDELMAIFTKICRDHDLTPTDEVAEAVREHLSSFPTGGEAGNARYARGLFEEMYLRMSQRAHADGVVETAEVTAFEVSDVPAPDPRRIGLEEADLAAWRATRSAEAAAQRKPAKGR